MSDDIESRTAVLSALLNERYSCRGFRPDPVPRATIDRILTLAQRTASWCNSQAWQVWVASQAATERLRGELLEYARDHAPQPDFAWPAYQGVYQERRRECGLQLYQATGVARGDRAASERQTLENFRFFGAPHFALVTTDEALGIYGAIDCGAYVSNFALAARAMGVASIAQAALAAHPQFWRERLGLAPDRKLVCGISFGYEDPAHPANSFRTSRASVAQATTWIE
ncbi:MAG TPA: nitroreductase [Ramlibacter sp.]|nr:nitroreductase [Ramlibacter sp.]